ncbi:MAG: stage II sporulation protein P [Christensenellales bacterium]
MNVVAVGEKLCTLLNERYGIYAIHDITDHEPPRLSSAYSRSLETMLEYKKKYPTIELFIDLHRDAYGNDPKAPADYLVIDGKECARTMFVVGTGEGATGAGFDEMPDFQSNYALAKGISEYLGTIHHSLARNIRVKVGRYNQHVSSHCLLAEIGHNANTFEQAMNSVEFLAEAIANAASAPASAQVEEEEALPTMLQLTP